MDGIARGGVAVVVGASGGIGAALVSALLQDDGFDQVVALSRDGPLEPEPNGRPTRGRIDVGDEDSIRTAASRLGGASGQGTEAGPLRLVIVATGLLHGDGLVPEKSYRALDADALMRTFRINTIGPALVAKHMLPLLGTPGRSVFAALSARVGSIGDNRSGGWHGYRASKAALAMILRNLAIETQRRTPQTLCVGLHPGTVDTALSRPFQRGVPEGGLFTPAHAASRLLSVLGGLHDAQSGSVLDWDGRTVPP